MVAGLRAVMGIARCAPFAGYLARAYLPASDDLDCLDGMDDAALEEHVRRWSATAYHPVGTCAMGTGDDSVVNSDLEVHGVERVRVVDASVMPTVISGNTNAPTIMIAEKAAERIGEQWRRRSGERHRLDGAQGPDQGPPADGEAGQGIRTAAHRPDRRLPGKNADLYVAVGVGASQGLFVVVPDGGDGGGGGENVDALEVLALEPGADALEVLGVEEELIASG